MPVNTVIPKPQMLPTSRALSTNSDDARASAGHEEVSPLISQLEQVNNCVKNFSTSKRQNSTDMLTPVRNSLWPPGSSMSAVETDHEKEDSELKQILAQGTAMRRQAEWLSGAGDEKEAPPFWRGHWFKLSLVALGLTASGAGYRYYAGRNSSGGQAENLTQPEALKPSVPPFMPSAGSGGVLEDSFPVFDLPHDSAYPAPRRGRQHQDRSSGAIVSTLAPQSKALTHRAPLVNRKITKALRASGYLNQKGKVTKEQQLSAVAAYIFNKNKGSTGSPEKTKHLARIILRENQLYGGEKSEPLSTAQAEATLRQWVFHRILGMSLEEYFVDKLRADDNADAYTVADLHEISSLFQLDKDNSLKISALTPYQREAFDLMWFGFLEAEIPVLKFLDNDKIYQIKLNSFEFANFYTGVRALEMMSVKEYTLEEAIQMGEKMWEMADHDGVKVNQLAYFSTPAQFAIASDAYERKQNKPDRITAINHYLNYRSNLSDLQKDINKKYQSYLSATREWLSKSPLADRIISGCARLTPGLPDIPSAIRSPAEQRQKSEAFAKQQYLLGMAKPCETAPESLDAEYRQLTSKVADSFRQLDKYLIFSAINALPQHEIDFISSPESSLYRMKTSIVVGHLTSPFSAQYFSKKDDEQKSALETTDFILVGRSNEQRVYALRGIKGDSPGYRFYRLNDTHDRQEWEPLNQKTVTAFRAPDDWGLRDSIKEFVFRDKEKLSVSADRTEDLVNSLSDIHRNVFYETLYATGNDKADIQKVWDVLKHFIPFYDCVAGIINHDPVQAVPDCLLDAVSMIPVLGKAGALSARFGMGASRGLATVITQAGKGGISSVSRNLLKSITLPTTSELASLGATTLRALDPGFEPVAVLGRASGKKLLEALSKDKKKANLGKTLNDMAVLDRLPPPPGVKPVTALLAETDLPVPVINIGKKDGRDLFVRVNPETGEAYGLKFHLIENDKFTKRLQRIRTQGLSGRRSVSASRTWQAQLPQGESSARKNIVFKEWDKAANSKLDSYINKIYTEIKTPLLRMLHEEYARAPGYEEFDAMLARFKLDDNGQLTERKFFDDFLSEKTMPDWVRSYDPGVTVKRIEAIRDDNRIMTLRFFTNKGGFRTKSGVIYPDVNQNYHIKEYSYPPYDTKNIDIKLNELRAEFGENSVNLFRTGQCWYLRMDINKFITDPISSEFMLFKQITDENGIRLNIHTYGNTESESLLFPEKHEYQLHAPHLNTPEYDTAFLLMNEQQRRAIREWVYVDDVESLSAGSSHISQDRSSLASDYLSDELNNALLSGQELTGHLKVLYDNLMSIYDLGILPKPNGEFIRLNEYTKGNINPWLENMNTGDIVTNGPVFLSVSDKGYYAKDTISAFGKGADAETFTTFKIFSNQKYNSVDVINSNLPIPLISKKIANQNVDESEYLYKPGSYFKVEGISVSSLGQAPNYDRDSITPRKRAGVVLQPIDSSDLSYEIRSSAKNIYTGRPIQRTL